MVIGYCDFWLLVIPYALVAWDSACGALYLPDNSYRNYT
jgi:hypothetical protein